MTLQRGAVVQLTIGAWTMPAMVTLASPNGRSLMVMFDGAAPVGNGYCLGVMALSQVDERPDAYNELITNTLVIVEHVERQQRPHAQSK